MLVVHLRRGRVVAVERHQRRLTAVRRCDVPTRDAVTGRRRLLDRCSPLRSPTPPNRSPALPSVRVFRPGRRTTRGAYRACPSRTPESSGDLCEAHCPSAGRSCPASPLSPCSSPPAAATPRAATTATAAAATSAATVAVDGSSTVFPMSDAAARAVHEEDPESRSPSAESGTGGGFERSAPARPTSPTPRARSRRTRRSPVCEETGIEYTELQVATDALTVVVNPDLDVDCLTVDQLVAAVGPGLQGHELERARPELPRPGDRAVRPRHRLRHLRLHGLRGRRPRRRGARDPRRLRGLRGRQRPRPGRRRHRGCHRLLRLHLLRGERRQPQGRSPSTAATAASSRRPRPRRPASTPRWPARSSST